MSSGSADWHRVVPASARAQILIGVIVVITCFFGFGAWALYAPLDGAVLATGTFVATGQNKQVQHLEGGILDEVLVGEGEIVEAGQVVARLDEIAPRAKLRRLQVRRIRLLMTRSRLEAEIRSEAELKIPDELRPQVSDPEVATIFERQRLELTAERKKLAAEKDVLRKEISGLKEGIIGYESQVSSAQRKMGYFQEELADKEKLLKQQLTRKTEVLAVRRAEAELSGTIGGLSGRIADAKERVARAQQQIATLDAAMIQKAVENLRATETDLDDVDEQIRAMQDIVNRTEVRAPVRGAVVKINSHTKGAVISPGGAILELVPVDDELIVETRVSPREISHITKGQPALVRLSGLSQRTTPMISGKVIYLSADAVPETILPWETPQRANVRGESFVVRVSLDARDAKSKVPTFKSTPGMPAEVFIQTGERTFFDYIMRPVLQSFSRAFKEA
jgi:membrane fusion protein, type I secretion system